jgi:hypothetical protein
LRSKMCARSTLRKVVQVLGVGFALLLMCVPAFSQVNLGRITGTITDQSGGVVAGATITVLDVARGVPRVLTTDDAGAYSAPALIPGAYTVRVETKGFSTVERKDVTVGVGQDMRVDVTLQPGEQTQLVTVTGEMPEVDTTNAQLGGTIQNQVIQDLPVEGRTFLALANYRPGIMTKPGAGGGLVQYTNGMRPDFNVFIFDGITDVNSFGTAGPLNIGYQAGGPDESVILSVDAIQEMNLVENAKAEYGWRPGAQENIGLKSGTNTIHGTAFAVGRSTGMQARNPFSFIGTTPFAAPTEYEQYGATVDGPLKRDKLFYLVSYEGQNYNVANPKTFTLPTLVSTGGTTGTTNSFPDAIADMNSRGISVTPLSLKLAGCTNTGATVGSGIPCTPNAGLFSNNLASTKWPTVFPVIGNSKNGVAKLDYHINDKNNFNIDYFQGYGHVNAPVSNTTQPYWSSPIMGSVSVGRVVWSWVPSTSLVNEVRAGWDYSLQVANAASDCSNPGAPNYAALGFNSGLNAYPACAFPQLTINGFQQGPNPTLGQPIGIAAKSINYSVLDNLSYTKGNHLIKVGFQFTHQIFNGQVLQYLSKGTLQFNANAAAGLPTALEAFLNGKIFSESLQIGNLQRTGTFNQYATYIQDDWRILPRLTLNLGLRWELQTPLHEQNNLMGVFDPNAPGGLRQTRGDNLYRLPVAFGPRFGLAWDMTGHNTTVVHAGFNVIYFQPTASDFLSFNSSIDLANNPTGGQYCSVTPCTGANLNSYGGTINVQNQTLTSFNTWGPLGGAIFTPPASPLCGPGQQPVAVSPTPPSPCKVYGVGHLTLPEFLEWNIGIQRAITNSMTLDVSYVGNHGQHQFAPIDINQPTPGSAALTGPPAVSAAVNEQTRRPYLSRFPYFSNIIMLGNPGRSNYNGLQASLTQRVTHGLSFTAGYTWQHSFDTVVTEVAMTVPQNSLNPNGDYGNSSLDVRHRITLQGTYSIPGVKSPLHVLEGWQVTSAMQIFSGLPYNALDNTDDYSGTGELQDRWNLFGNPKDFKGTGVTPLPFFSGASIPAACTNAAANVPTGPPIPGFPTGMTGANALNLHGCYAEGNSVILPPAQGTFGNMQRFSLRGTGFRVWDMTLVKNIQIKERLTAQFRAECYNVLNSVQYAVPTNVNPGTSSNFGTATGTPNIVANSPIIGNGDARRFQLGLRFSF